MLEITVKPILGSYSARASGDLWEGHLQEQDAAHLPQGHKLFHFHTADEITP